MVKRKPAAQRAGKDAGMLHEGQAPAGNKLRLGLRQVVRQLYLVRRRDGRLLASNRREAGWVTSAMCPVVVS